MESPSGIRARKRLGTRARVTDAAMALFLRQGFDATTIDEIAAAAGISRRSFFNHFASKDDVAAAWMDGKADALAAEVARRPVDEAPLDMAANALLALSARYDAVQARALATFAKSTPVLQAREAGKYQAMEAALLAALAARTGREANDLELRIAAAVAISMMRLSADYWLGEARDETMQDYARRLMATLKATMANSR